MIYPQNFEKKIEFDQIRSLIKGHCLSTLGTDKADAMCFSDDFGTVTRLLDETMEFVSILHGSDDFPSQFFFDMRGVLQRIRIQGMFVETQELFDLRRSLETIRDITRFLKSDGNNSDDSNEEGPVPYPCLRQKAGDINAFPKLIDRINSIIGPFGQIKDNASPELARIRHELSTTKSSISRILNGILRSAQAEGVVEKDVAPTMRDGRLVIPVAPALKRRIKGIVHDESATGKTVFIEPVEVVNANNRIRELEGDEHREVVRILMAFSDGLRPLVPELLMSYDFLGEIDFIRAKALLADSIGGIKPAMEDCRLIDWGAAVHPLLQMSLQKHGKKVVPLDIELQGKRRILLISGPNAGGKSVCLKTVGLLQYMLQCGLPVPMHERSHAGIFSSIFIDIGDEQSIEDDLSTYSSHLQNMKVMMKQCDTRSLILIDEFGGGTEPQIGGAIAEAVLERLNAKGTFGVITTHYQNLKHFAENHEGVVNGAMLYDRNRMQALFQLQIGLPGSSFAVEIARKIGLPEDVIEEASKIVGSDYINSDKYLQDIVRDRRYWASKRQNIHQREKVMEETIARYQKEMEELQKERKDIVKKAHEEAETMMREANAKIENTIRSIKEAQAQKEETRKARRELEDFRQRLEEEAAREQDDRIARKMEQLKQRQERRKDRKSRKANASDDSHAALQARQEAERVARIVPGAAVRMKGQSTVGQVLDVNGKNVTVAFGSIKTTVTAERLEPATAQQGRTGTTQKSSYLSTATQDAMHEKRLNFKQDIDVRGMRGDEAVMAVTYFIDDAILCGVSRVRILHGTGTGALRTLIRQYLSTVNGVADYHDEDVRLGGAGITVVDLD